MAHILVVNDDPSIGCMLTEILELEGHYVELATDGRQGLKALSTATKQMIVLMNGMMPNMDGIGLLRIVAADAELLVRHVYVWNSANAIKLEHVRELTRWPPQCSLLQLPVPFTVDKLFTVVAEATQQLEML